MEDRVSIATPDHVTLEFELAGLGSRFCAFLLDALIIVFLIIIGVVVIALAGITEMRLLARGLQGGLGWLSSWNLALLVFFIFLVAWGYYVFLEGLNRGVTPGKKMLGLRVITDTGLPIGLREAALRNLVRAADLFPPPSGILGGLVMYLDDRGRRLGDMVAGTLVVVEAFDAAPDTAVAAAWAARVERGRSRRAVTLPRGTLTPHQIGLIEQFIARRHTLPREKRALLAWQIAQPLLPLLGESKEAVGASADRLSYCEEILLEVLSLARADAPNARVKAASPNPSGLF